MLTRPKVLDLDADIASSLSTSLPKRWRAGLANARTVPPGLACENAKGLNRN